MDGGNGKPSWWRRLLQGACPHGPSAARAQGASHQAIDKLSFVPTSRALLHRQYDSVSTPVVAISVFTSRERSRPRGDAAVFVLTYRNAAVDTSLGAGVRDLINDCNNEFSCKLWRALSSAASDGTRMMYFQAKVGPGVWSVQVVRCILDDAFPSGKKRNNEVDHLGCGCLGFARTRRAAHPSLILHFHPLNDEDSELVSNSTAGAPFTSPP
ncbi:hypothetical protein Vretifemale_17114, partial [Volvox reticuliferus]